MGTTVDDARPARAPDASGRRGVVGVVRRRGPLGERADVGVRRIAVEHESSVPQREQPFGAVGARQLVGGDEQCRAVAVDVVEQGEQCVAPGLIRTEFSRALWENEKILREATMGSALRRIGEPDEMAGAAVYFASPASSFTTGQTLVMDGGQLV